MKRIALFVFALLGAFQLTMAQDAQVVKVNYSPVDVVDIAIGSDAHTTLVAAVKAAGLVETLKGDGPFTIFAPTNDAFDRLPEGTVATLLKPENKDQLTSILTYHVVAGNYMSTDVVKALKDNSGKFTVNTVNGAELTIWQDGENIKLKDTQGNYATITAVDLKGSNGVVHVIDAVVMP